GNVSDLGRLGPRWPCCGSRNHHFRVLGRGKNQRYCANGSHDRYPETVMHRIGTGKSDRYPLNGQPGPGRPAGTKPQQAALPDEQAEQATTVMMDQQNYEATRPVSADPAVALAEALGQLPTVPVKAPA